MNIGAAIFSILSGDGTLTTALGGNKIYPSKAPQTTAAPYIIYNQINSVANDTKDGVSSLDVIRVQFDVYHVDHTLGHTLSERIRTVLDKYSGTAESIAIDSVQYLSMNPTGWEDSDDLFRISEDYSFRVKL